MIPSQIEQYRPGFEAWYRSNPQNIDRPGLPLHRWNLGDDGLGDYRNQFVRAYWDGWIASKADSQVVTEEMVERAAIELGNPSVPTVFTRCSEVDGFRAYIVGYADDAGNEVIRYRGASGAVAESEHFNVENEVMARAVLSAALNPVITPVDGMEGGNG